MTKDEIKRNIIDIVCKQCGLENTAFTSQPNDGDNLHILDLSTDILDQYEILNLIEKKFNIMLDDSKFFNHDTTLYILVDCIYNEIRRKNH